MQTSFKQKMLLVALIHLAATMIVLFLIPGGNATCFKLTPVFWRDALYLLQPQAWVWDNYFCWGGIRLVDGTLKLFLLSCVYASIPLWSICFGWIYVKFTNWLNHFPILGKRVF